MANLISPNWNTRYGLCEKHWIPQIPCPECIAEKDKDIEIELTIGEREGMKEIMIPSGFEDRCNW